MKKNSADESGKRRFVLDTNVLMHDPAALFRFQEHDIHIPMMVLEELDRAKKGASEVARNVRQVSRFLDEMMADVSKEAIDRGLALPAADSASKRGRLFFQTQAVAAKLPVVLPGNTPDNDILSVAVALSQSYPESHITLVSKDINLRIKAALVGIHAEDYFNDQVLDDVNLLYSGWWRMEADFWDTYSRDLESWREADRVYYRLHGAMPEHCYPNQYLYAESNADSNVDLIVREITPNSALLEQIKDYSAPKQTVWGISARNREQNFALNLLLDPAIDFVTLLGTAGTGKTLLALAAGLAQTLDEQRYREIIMTRAAVPVGEDIGFLPGTEEEKMTPWMGALMDNLEVLAESDEGGAWGRAATQDLLSNRIKIRAMNFMRGRTFQNKFVIIDEAQNLTSKQMKTLITRAGPGTKVVCLGNLGQIDTPYLSETTSGLTYVVDRFKQWPYSGHITLRRGERSRLAEFASDSL